MKRDDNLLPVLGALAAGLALSWLLDPKKQPKDTEKLEVPTSLNYGDPRLAEALQEVADAEQDI